MIDHVSMHVSNPERSKRFYAAALAPLGYRVSMEFPGVAGLGAGGKPDLWLAEGRAGEPIHVAVLSERRDGVDAFHRAALAAGGRDNRAPGLRPQYHPTYYGAFALDPDGNNVEAVCHRPE
jgi:catechol 2,3-dioxygenase-like lactoylglutathione lyase family enzyme